ncbi:MAG: 4-hydroxy-2-oxoheptanedioate aldolase [Polaribacter sp.]|jgi:4-hydroxy-2-oxoheptanedioate aldolase
MRKNKLKEIWASNGTALLGWLHIPNTWTAELMANAGWDAVTVDMQHGLHNIETAIQMMQAISTTETVPLARVNWNEPGSIMRLLDGGAYGIICPMINSGEECKQFVGACRYPPLGYRSFGPTRARIYSGLDYGDHANEEMLAIAMVETKEAVENIDDICSVKGLDGIFVGSGDLRLSLTGSAKQTTNTQLFDEAIDTILAACKKYKVLPGIWCATVADAQKQKNKGFRFIALKSDSMMLNEIARQQASDLRSSF